MLLIHSPDLSDPYNKNLFKIIETINLKENADLIIDINNIKDRLALRENGNVVVTYHS